MDFKLASPAKHDRSLAPSAVVDTVEYSDVVTDFPDKDINMKIDKKDIVFIYEMDDIINSINDGRMEKKLRPTQ